MTRTRTRRSLKIGAISAAAVVAILTVASGRDARACDPNAYLGSLCFTGAIFCPEGFVPADSSLVSMDENPSLYAVVGNSYGGDPSLSFGVPTVGGRELIGANELSYKTLVGASELAFKFSSSGLGLSSFQLGEVVGSEKFMLSARHLPVHTHEVLQSQLVGEVAMPATSLRATEASPEGHVYAATVDGMYSSSSNFTVRTMTPSVSYEKTTAYSVAPAERTGVAPEKPAYPIPIVGPQLGLNVCISVTGIFPPRE